MNRRFGVVAILILLIAVLVILGSQYDNLPYFGTTDLNSNPTVSMVVDPRFDLVRNFSHSLAAVRKGNDWGYINRSGDWVIEPRFGGALEFEDGMAPVRVSGRWGFVDSSGRLQIEPRFDRVRTFSENRAAVKQSGSWGFINTDGETVTPIRFEYAESFQNGLGLIQVEGRKTFVDTGGQRDFEQTFGDAHGFKEGVAAVEIDDLWGYVSRSGTFVVEPQYLWASSFNSNHARALTGNGWVIVQSSFETIPVHEFDLMGSPSDSVFSVIDGSNWGFVNDRGTRLSSTASFDAVIPFQNGLAPVKQDSDWGYVDQNGSWVVKPAYDAAGQFYEGRARVKINGKWGFLGRGVYLSDTSRAVPVRRSDTQTVPLNRSLSEDFPTWFNPPAQRYISVGRGVLERRWHLERTSPTGSYGYDEVLYEVTKYPYQFPNAVQHEAAEELYDRSLQAAREQGLFDFQNALKDGFTGNKHGATHFHNLDYSTDTRALVPGQPEYLIYYGQGTDQRLTGFMYLESGLFETGHQVGGNLTKWHYHRYSSEKCFRHRIIIQHGAEKCPAGLWQRRAPEMLHIWFIDHPQGSHGTRMEFFEDLVPGKSLKYVPKLTN